jgi:hypothetical protein
MSEVLPFDRPGVKNRDVKFRSKTGSGTGKVDVSSESGLEVLSCRICSTTFEASANRKNWENRFESFEKIFVGIFL